MLCSIEWAGVLFLKNAYTLKMILFALLSSEPSVNHIFLLVGYPALILMTDLPERWLRKVGVSVAVQSHSEFSHTILCGVSCSLTEFHPQNFF